jgi:ubiquitin-like protein ATG12
MAENADSSSSAASSDKVVILLRATGDAPILRQDKVKIGGAQRFASVVDYLRKQLQRDSVVRQVQHACVNVSELTHGVRGV